MYDYESSSRYRDDEQMLIDDACDSLYQIGFDRTMFMVHCLRSYFYTDTHKKFLEFIEPISNIKDLDALNLIFSGCKGKNDFKTFASYVEWLKKTDEGRSLLDKSLRPITKPLKESDVNLARKLIEYRKSQDQAAKDVKEELDRLISQGGELQRKAFDIHNEVKARLGPLIDFEELSIHELRIKAYELYENDCKSKGIEAIPYHRSNGYETAIGMFGDTLKEKHFLDFLNEPSRSIEIVKHFSDGGGSN